MKTSNREWRIIATRRFDHQIKQLRKKHYRMDKLKKAIEVILDEDENLLRTKYKLHALAGDKSGLYGIHLQSNWLLIYEITDNTLFLTLTLSATGTHQATLGK